MMIKNKRKKRYRYLGAWLKKVYNYKPLDEGEAWVRECNLEELKKQLHMLGDTGFFLVKTPKTSAKINKTSPHKVV